MKFKKLFFYLVTLMILGACSSTTPTPTITETPSPTPTLSPPGFAVTRAPDPVGVGTDFLELWKVDDYAGMYGLLSSASQAAVSQDVFTARYLNVLVEAAIPTGELDYEIGRAHV